MIQEAKEDALYFLRKMGCTDTASKQQIEDAVLKTLKLYDGISKDELLRHIESEYKIWVDDFRIIEKEEARRPWLAGNKSKIEWGFWNRYKWYLEEKKKFPPKTVQSIDKLTDRTLDALFEPTQKAQIDKRGMVVGQVQSGKTANYTGLICKAADAGFKMIIVLAGIHKNLRSQTQLRLDEGFLGFDTQYQRAFQSNNLWIGVGEQRSNRHLIAHSLTSSLDNGDFNAGAANALALNFYTNDPIIAVVKKNAHVLNRLEQWLAAQSTETSNGDKIIKSKPLLIIDDEADNASINTKRDELNPTRINGQIRNLLRLFQKSAYVGYTATPFANIFIPLNEDNLFPRDFITNIPAPTNYVGPDKIFGFEPLEDGEEPMDTLPVVHKIDDYQNFVPDRHKQRDEQLPVSVPESLKTAIKCFILTCSIRRLRGQGSEHNSMLIHVSRFTNWQAHIKELVENVFNFYRLGIEQNNPLILNEIRATFENDSDSYRSYVTTSTQILNSQLAGLDPNIKVHSWKEILPFLHPSTTKIQVKEIHGGAKDVLDYQAYDKKYVKDGEEAGLSVIAVGGNKLSRGLTLEGLSVSYYLRASRMYDTLMQMGRWFGYRPGYVDLCRLFTSRELNEWFCHITLASEELRKEFNYMSEIAGSTPEQYALKVRTHPGVLQISATNKIRTAVNVNISWSGVLIESYKLSKRTKDIAANLDNLNNLVASFNSQPRDKKGNLLWTDIPASDIVSFISSFVAPDNPIASPERLGEFIIEKQKDNELDTWHVALMSSRSKSKDYSLDNNQIWLFDRTDAEENNSDEIYYIRKSHIISPSHEFIDLTEEEYELALEKTLINKKSKAINPNEVKKPNYPSGKLVRNNMEFTSARFPLLLLYLLNPEKAGLPDTEKPIVGFAIRFPGSKNNTTVTYAVHEQLLDKFEVNEDPEDYEYED